jgi:DNA-binding NtrC family response regulator
VSERQGGRKLLQQQQIFCLERPWPSDVRGLANTLRGAAARTPAETGDADDAPRPLLPSLGRARDGAAAILQQVRQRIDLNSIRDRVARHYLKHGTQ